MLFLLDTCVISDAARPQHYPGLAAWLGAQASINLAISVLSLGELRYGVEKPPSGRKRAALVTWLQTALLDQLRGRVLPIDDRVADAWGLVRATGEASGRPLPVIDGMLLATAQAHALTFVTRNLRDVEYRGVGVLDPY